jgi:hypothetical protein
MTLQTMGVECFPKPSLLALGVISCKQYRLEGQFGGKVFRNDFITIRDATSKKKKKKKRNCYRRSLAILDQ